LAFFRALEGLLTIFSKGGSKVEERLGFRSGNCEIVEVVTEVEVWVAFYRGKVTF